MQYHIQLCRSNFYFLIEKIRKHNLTKLQLNYQNKLIHSNKRDFVFLQFFLFYIFVFLSKNFDEKKNEIMYSSHFLILLIEYETTEREEVRVQ